MAINQTALVYPTYIVRHDVFTVATCNDVVCVHVPHNKFFYSQSEIMSVTNLVIPGIPSMIMTKNIDEHFMEIALEQAQISFADGNFPVGAVLVIDGVEIDRSRNLFSTNSDWISHIE